MTTTDLTNYRLAGVITAREYDVLLLRIRGLSQYTIAIALDISRSTVRSAQRNATSKIERHQRSNAA